MGLCCLAVLGLFVCVIWVYWCCVLVTFDVVALYLFCLIGVALG